MAGKFNSSPVIFVEASVASVRPERRTLKIALSQPQWLELLSQHPDESHENDNYQTESKLLDEASCSGMYIPDIFREFLTISEQYMSFITADIMEAGLLFPILLILVMEDLAYR